MRENHHKKQVPQNQGDLEKQKQQDAELSEIDPISSLNLPGITLDDEPLSRGPLTAIYRGWDHNHRCPVIVKVQLATDDQIVADRFRREAEVMKRLRHPNIVALYQFHDNNPSALVMEYVPGQTLGELVTQEKRLEPVQAVQFIEEIAAALDCIHTQGVIHRDVKPSNILIPKHGPARLSDFGVAHVDKITPLTRMGDILGTIEYISPEQIHGNKTPDARSDVYSLAAVAYFALTGVPPFHAADNTSQAQLSVMHRQVFAEPEPLQFHRKELPLEINSAVLRGLSKSPSERYDSAGQLAAALRSAVEVASGAPERKAIALASRRTGTLVGTLTGATLLVFGVVATREMWSPPEMRSSKKAVPSSPGQVSLGPISQHKAPLILPLPPRSKQNTAMTAPESTRSLVAGLPSSRHPHQISTLNVLNSVRVGVADSNQEGVFKQAFSASVERASTSLIRKKIVAERPKYRRHPDVVAAIGTPAGTSRALKAKPLHKTIPLRPTPLQPAWLTVYASQDLTLAGKTTRQARITAHAVYVDGHLMPSLALGGWAALTAGKHLISYVPASQSGYSRNPGVWVTLAAGTHVNKQILLPVATGANPLLSAASSVSASPVPLSIQKPIVVSPPPALVSATSTAVGWYTVSGWAAKISGKNSKNDQGQTKPDLVRASAQWVKVDGQPVPALASGDWAELPAGKHTVTFQPALGLGVGPKTWDIELAGHSHLQQQVPLPASTFPSTAWYTVSGWIAVSSSEARPTLIRASAQWVKVDGQPVPPLSLGGWAELPAGKHTVTFLPTPGLGMGPKTWEIDLPPQAHLDQKVPLSSSNGSS